MNVVWTVTQLNRLKELEAEEKDLRHRFESDTDREREFQTLENKLVRSARQRLDELRTGQRFQLAGRLLDDVRDVAVDVIGAVQNLAGSVEDGGLAIRERKGNPLRFHFISRSSVDA